MRDIFEAHAKNFPGCNHHLTSEAVQALGQMDREFGDAPFSWRAQFYPEAVIVELIDQGFLVECAKAQVRRNKAVFGRS